MRQSESVSELLADLFELNAKIDAIMRHHCIEIPSEVELHGAMRKFVQGVFDGTIDLDKLKDDDSSRQIPPNRSLEQTRDSAGFSESGCMIRVEDGQKRLRELLKKAVSLVLAHCIPKEKIYCPLWKFSLR